MTHGVLRITTLSFAAATFAVLAASAQAQQNTSPSSAPQQQSYPQQQNPYPNSTQPQSTYPEQQNGYPNSAPQPSPDRNRRDADRDRRGDSASDMSVPDNDAAHNWTTDQILTATVHQAWILSGKNEANFFEIVKELAEISARNRNLMLPDDPAVGRRAGEYIKEQARADHDQLLYDIVDKSVRMTGRPTNSEAAVAR